MESLAGSFQWWSQSGCRHGKLATRVCSRDPLAAVTQSGLERFPQFTITEVIKHLHRKNRYGSVFIAVEYWPAL